MGDGGGLEFEEEHPEECGTHFPPALEEDLKVHLEGVCMSRQSSLLRHSHVD